MHTKIIIISLFTVFVITAVFGQDVQSTFKLKQQIPTSPEASALGKFGDIPVGLYTGVPNINIPLYNLKMKDFELPISLSYNSSGVKVEEVAPNTGLGWALNAGGTISASVNGLRDFETGGYANLLRGDDTIPAIVINPDVLAYNYGQSGGGPLYEWGKRVLDGTADSQPDLFYYSYPGSSGKFYTDQHRQWHPVPFAAIKIEYPIATQICVITDEQGRKFTYGLTETSMVSSNCGNPIVNGTALLTKIELPDRNTINFNYTTVNYGYYMQPSVSRNKVAPGNDGVHIHDCTNPTTYINMSGQRLSSITSTTGAEIDFVYNTNRTDLPGTQSLDAVIIKNQNKIIDQYSFAYSYFNSGGSTTDDHRLKLLSITNQNGGQYNFSYNEAIALPNRMSYAQDHWGYYNGKTTNNSLLPFEPAYGFLDGANREVDTAYSQLGILKKIIYPTGGSTLFDYEQNDYYFAGDEYTYQNVAYNAYGLDNQIVTQSFTIPPGTNVVSGTVNYNDGTGSYSGTGLGGEPIDPTTTITVSSDNGFYHSYYNTQTTNGIKAIGLAPGNYTISINAQAAANGAYCTVNATYRVAHSVAYNKFLGGLRIKTLTNKASATSPDEVKQYVYRKKDQPGISSGNVNFYPLYTSTYIQVYYPTDDPGNPVYVNYYKQTTGSVYPIGAIKGGSVAYTFVSSLNGVTGQNGKTESTFTFSGITGGSLSYPTVPYIDHDYQNGLLTNEVKYRNQAGTYQPLVKEQHFYSIQPESVFWNTHYNPSTYNSNYLFRGRGVSIIYKKPEMAFGVTIYAATFLVNDYRIISEWVRTDSSRTVNYIYNGSTLADSVSTNNQLTYNNTAHLLPSISTTKTSKNTIIQTTSNYPQDYATGTSVVIDSLVAQHRIATTLQKQVNNNGSVQTSKTLYRDWGNRVIEPEYVQSQYNSQPLENRLQFYAYDTKANPLTASQSNGPLVSYQWAYNQQYPIAECKNAASDEFFTQNFEEVSGAAAGGHTGLQYYNGSYTTGDKLAPNYHGKSYVISYWYTNGSGVWTYSGEMLYTGQTLSGNIDDVRIYPKDAQITTYTYSPLVGMTSMTDAKGQTTTYEYDSFQRLLNIRDQYGNIVKHTDYHYQNQ